MTSHFSIPSEWALDAVFALHPALRLAPSRSDAVMLRGPLNFTAESRDGVVITDTFEIEVRIPRSFPRDYPHVVEIGGRIPKDFHQHPGGVLCLGTPIRIVMEVGRTPTVAAFLERLVVPYLFGFSYFSAFGRMPFGELAHGTHGVTKDLQALLGMPPTADGRAILAAGALRPRVANKRICPCGSGRRLGRCHHRRLNLVRKSVGRVWFRRQRASYDDMAVREA